MVKTPEQIKAEVYRELADMFYEFPGGTTESYWSSRWSHHLNGLADDLERKESSKNG